MNYTFKQLSSSDVGLFRQLMKVFGEAFQDIETYQGKPPGDEYVKGLLEQNDFICLVAMENSQVVGGGSPGRRPGRNKSRRCTAADSGCA
jgi:aminoglycoside 3-N-acetyltransferase I